MKTKVICVLGDEIGLEIIREAIPDLKPNAIIISSNRPAAKDVAYQWSEDYSGTVWEQPPKYNEEQYDIFVNMIKTLEPDLGLCFSYDKIISAEILDCFKLGVFNIHGSLLPKYRGANVVNWVIINGEKHTGVTLHKMSPEVDSGPIVCQKEIAITFDDTALTLRDKINQGARELIASNWRPLCNGNYELIEQDETQVTRFGRRKPEDGFFSWDMSVMSIYNLIRGLVKPWPGAWYIADGQKIVIDSFMNLKDVESMQKEMIGFVAE